MWVPLNCSGAEPHAGSTAHPEFPKYLLLLVGLGPPGGGPAQRRFLPPFFKLLFFAQNHYPQRGGALGLCAGRLD